MFTSSVSPPCWCLSHSWLEPARNPYEHETIIHPCSFLPCKHNMEKKSVNITACFPARENSARHVAAIWKPRVKSQTFKQKPIDRKFPLDSGSAPRIDLVATH